MLLNTSEVCTPPAPHHAAEGCDVVKTIGEPSLNLESTLRHAALHRGVDTQDGEENVDVQGDQIDSAAPPPFSIVPQGSSTKLVKNKSFKKRFKGKMLKALKMDDKSVEVRQIRRLSVERVALGDLFESFTIPLKGPEGEVKIRSIMGVEEVVEDEVTAEEMSETGSNPLSEPEPEPEPDAETFEDLDPDLCEGLKIETAVSARLVLQARRAEDLHDEQDGADGADEQDEDTADHEDEGDEDDDEEGSTFTTIEVSRRKSDSEAFLRSHCEQLESSNVRHQARRASTNTMPTCLNNKSSSPRRRGSITFDPSVKVIPIPRIKDYPRETRRMMWGCPFDNLYALDVFEASGAELPY